MTLLRLVAAVALAGVIAPGRPADTPAAAAPAPIVIVGVDGADWLAIDPLVAANRLPAFAALKRAGSTGVMRAEPPLLSPIIWTTIATGRRPEDHGVLDFMVDAPGGQAPVTGGSRAVKALWEIFSDAGRPVFVAGWWATWPADHVRGLVVSDRVAAPHVRIGSATEGLVSPPEQLNAVLAARVAPEAIDYDALNALVPLTRAEFDEASASMNGQAGTLYTNKFSHARAALAAARTYRRATTTWMPRIAPAFSAVYYELVDTVEHLFIADPRRRDRAIAAAYEEIDHAIADTARAAPPDALILVVSDHGFLPPDAGVVENPADLTSGAAAWHRPYGIVAAATARTIAGSSAEHGAPIGDVSPLDIAPTVLARAGLAVARDMPGKQIRSLAPGEAQTIASYGAHRQPATAADSTANGRAEFERLRSLGYVTGSSSTSLARVNLGEILFRKGDIRGAIVELEALVRADPLNQRALLWLARSYAAASRVDDAAGVYERMIRMSAAGERVDPLVVLAATDLDVEHGHRERAQERLARLPKPLADSGPTYVAQGTAAAAAGNAADAERWFRKALAAEPADGEALSRTVDLLMSTGRTAAAARLAADAARRFPGSPDRLALVGETALAERRYADAVRSFESALRIAPDAPSVRVDLARAHLLAGRADAALAAVAGLASRDAEAIRGAAHANKRDWAAAAAAYERALAAGAPTVDLLNALGVAQLESGRNADAVRTLERSLAAKPDQPDVKLLLQRARSGARPSSPHGA